MHKFAVVDIETTGLVSAGHGITEVAVVHLDGSELKPAFHSVVNPGRDIPGTVSRLTGIDRGMTEYAPTFAEIAAPLAAALEGRIFAAHQVNFDYSFLKNAFEACGMSISQRRLCTLRLARRASAAAKGAGLSTLCKRYGVHNTDPHRAMGDALAAAEILKILAEREGGRFLEEELRRANRAAIIPAQLDADAVNALPEVPGVYYFYSAHSRKPIYIGKAVNLKKRVVSHFTSPGGSRRKQCFQREVARVEYAITGSAYMALLREDADIRKFFPKYNRAQKARVLPVAVRLYCTRDGREKAGIVRTSGHPDDLAVFASPREAREWLLLQMRTFGFDPLSAGLSPLYADDLPTRETSAEAEAFRAFAHACRNARKSHFALLDHSAEGRTPYVLVKNGQYRGFGTWEGSGTPDPYEAEAGITAAPESTAVRAVLRKMEEDKRIQKINFQ